MKRFLKYLALTVVLIVSYITIIFIGTDKGWWYTAFTKEKAPDTFVALVQRELQNEFVGNLAVAMFKRWKASIRILSF